MSEICGLCNVIGLVFIEAGGLKLKIEPPLGVMEKPRSAIAASKSVQDIEPRASDVENRVFKSAAVDALTWNCWTGSGVTSCGVFG